jgi:CDP-6-deoxy-D-xylo-4-hexulose-3-dehydrase
VRPELAALVREEMTGLPVEAHDAESGHPLVVPGYGADEVLGALDALLSTRVTMGAQVRAFEAAWAARCGRRHGVMVNSGSSANLLVFAALVEIGRLAVGDEVLVPAVTWSTSLFPVLQVGLRPKLVDVSERTLGLDRTGVDAARGPRTRAALAVHLLGQPCETDLDLLVVEDACGAHGASVGGRPVGSLGHAATFSFFFSHHITTIEGGIVVTDDDALADAMRSLRAHGWIRERSDRDVLAARSPEVDPRFLFVSAGWNLRPTEIAGAFGLVQDRRLDAWVERRRRNHADWCAALAGKVEVFPELPGTAHAGFAFPMLHPERARICAALEAAGVETRPISGSNLARQPVWPALGLGDPGPLPVADRVHTDGFFVGNSHAFGPAHGERLARLIGAIT